LLAVRASERPTLARVAPFLVLAITFLAYAAVSGFGFVYDDEGQIVHDSFVQHWHFFPAYFVSHVWQYVVPHVGGNYYRPVFLTWLLLNFKLFGLHAAGWHLAVVFLHLVVTYQVYRLGAILLDNEPAALVAAALFGLHPVHIEAVAWISGATEPLAAVFILGSLLSYIAFRARGRHATYVLSLVCFCLAMLTKETAVLVPVVLFAHDLLLGREVMFGPGGRIRKSVPRLAPFALLLGGYLIARLHALHALTRRIVDLDLRTTLLTIPSVLAFYARLLLVPTRLSAFYDTPYITTPRPALLPGIGCVVVAGIAATLLWRFRSRVAGFAVVLLLFPLLPLMNLSVFPQGEIAHDRYLYLSSIGFALLLGLLTRVIAKNAGRDRQRVWIGCVMAICVLYFYGTLTQSLYWANDLVLYVRGVQIAPNNLIARTDLGTELMARGKTDLALAEYRDVLRRDPQYWLARYNLGYAEYSANDCGSAVHDLEVAAAEVPTDAETMFYLGHCRFQLGDRRTGIAFMRHGIELDPRMANFRAQLADDLVLTDLPDDLRAALQLYRTEAASNPAHPTAARRAAALAARMEAK
jgi:protein O-mannosyl-transferase